MYVKLEMRALSLEIFKKANNHGILCVVAAGNDRNSVHGTGHAHVENPDTAVVGTPANERNSLAVASVENETLQSISFASRDWKAKK